MGAAGYWFFSPQALRQRQEGEQEALEGSRQLQKDRGELQGRVAGLQASLRRLEAEKTELERGMSRLGKDKASLRKTLEKVRGVCVCVYRCAVPTVGMNNRCQMALRIRGELQNKETLNTHT